MNYPKYYHEKNETELYERALEVLCINPLPLPADTTDETYKLFRLGNEYRKQYRYHLMGFEEHPYKLYKAAISFLKEGAEILLPVINQDNIYLLDELIMRELFEIMPKLLEINGKLADRIEREFPHLDASCLRDREKAEEALKSLMSEVEKLKKHGLI